MEAVHSFELLEHTSTPQHRN